MLPGQWNNLSKYRKYRAVIYIIGLLFAEVLFKFCRPVLIFILIDLILPLHPMKTITSIGLAFSIEVIIHSTLIIRNYGNFKRSNHYNI